MKPELTTSAGAQQTPIVAAVVQAIESSILDGSHAPGSALPEVPLARQLKASRSTVREALRILEDRGIVEIYSYRGAFVPRLVPQKALETVGLRAVLEGYAARLGVEYGRIRGSALETIRDAYDDLRRAAEQGDALLVIEADMEFHRRISAACGHDLVLEHLASLQAQTRRFILATKLYESDLEGEVDSHLPVLLAITSGDPGRAESAVRDHITRSGQLLLARMAEVETAAPPGSTRASRRTEGGSP